MLLEEEVASADHMLVEMPSTEMCPHKKKYKRKRDLDRQANDASSADELVMGKLQPATLMSSKNNNKKSDISNGTKTQGKHSPNKELFGVSFLEDAKPAENALPNSGAASLRLCSTSSTKGSCILGNYGHCGIVQGRFSKEEDEIIKDAASCYIERNKLGKGGVHMILNCRKYPHIKKGCWTEIAAAIPWRLPRAVRRRAEKLFLNDLGHKWTQEEIEFVQRYVTEHGKCWKSVGELLGVHWEQAWYVWRRNRNPNFQLGPWSQHECQQLFDLVHKDLRKKAFMEKNENHHRFRENISWAEISNEIDTRYDTHICQKWYGSLSSSMVSQGLWSETDDYHLIDSLVKLDASCVEDIDWDNILDDRSGAICHKRWMEMTKHIGGNIEKPFMEQVELLSKRYRIDMLEHRERAIKKSS